MPPAASSAPSANAAVVSAIAKQGPAMLAATLDRAASGPSTSEETTGLKVSAVKGWSSVGVGFANWLFKAKVGGFTLAKWDKRPEKANFNKNMKAYGAPAKAMMQECFKTSLGVVCDGETTSISVALDNILKTTPSRFTQGRNDSEAGKTTSNSKLYQNISEWDASIAVQPTQRPFSEFYKLADLYVVKALNEVANTAIMEKLGKTMNTSTPTYVQATRLIEKDRAMAKGANVRGTKASDAVDEALHILSTEGDAIVNSQYWMNCETAIPSPSHLAYEFNGGALHHAVYLGSSVIVEVTNRDTGGVWGGINGFITITHLHDFLKRARNAASPLYIYKYANPFPADMVNRRAIWGLGKYDYHLRDSNCETFANWVFANVRDTCMKGVSKTAVVRKNSTRKALGHGGRRASRRSTRNNK